MERLVLKEGAIFLADAHENDERRGFWEFLKTLERSNTLPPQLFLMGDIFDLFIGEISATHCFAKPYVALLESLAEKMEIYYFEGNHDFNLKRFFKRVKFIPQKNQPVSFILHTSKGKNLTFLLAHGDIFLQPFLQFLLGLLRKPFLLWGLNLVNQLTFKSLSKKIQASQKTKNLGYKIENFKNLAYERYEKYGACGSWVMEGHFHQNFILNEDRVKYFNLASFANERSFFVVKCHQEVEFKEMRGQECLMKIL